MAYRILIVDGQRVFNDAMLVFLRHRGCEVVLAEDDVAAERLLNEHGFDLAVLDRRGSQDGRPDVARTIAQRGGIGTRTKIVALTDQPEGAPPSQPFFDTVLHEPVDIRLLFQIVDTYRRTMRATPISESVTPASAGFPAESDRWRALALPVPADGDELQRLFDFTPTNRPDVVLLTNAEAAAEVMRQRTGGSWFMLPVIDTTGFFAATADAVFKPGAPDDMIAAINDFARRQQKLAAAFKRARSFDEKLLAYIHLSGRMLVPLADQPHAIGFSGFWPAAETHDAVERLMRSGFLARAASEHGGYGYRLADAAHDVLQGTAAVTMMPRAEARRDVEALYA